MSKKRKVAVPKVITARKDPEEVDIAYTSAPAGEVIEVAEKQAEAPPIVLALAARVNGTPWTWYVGEKHVSIVMTNGKKFRFERANIP